MRPSLKWALAGSVCLTVGVWLLGPNAPTAQVVEATPVRGAPGPLNPGAAPTAMAPLPAHWPALAVSAAQRDVFAAVQPPATPAPKVVAQAAVVNQTSAQVPPPPPPAPAVSYRFLGRMRTPEGQVLTLLQRDDKPVTLSVGLVLDDGYVVQAIEPLAVRLFYPPTATVVELPTPASAETGSGW
ncbi:hypothetical protein [Ideonella paludis]|uniref:Secretion system X translation initiation factor n=1 Tax=Ideonella paludis TaxID=1233411 RepID=A0ABS5DVD2_9BURK|nr:hypothetical protein [Ideonella paludis]MBQ0935107.1 hypothetical protein [Ideonella paludis]